MSEASNFEFQVVEVVLVDLAGERNDASDGVAEGLAGTRNRLLHAVRRSAGGSEDSGCEDSGAVGSGSGVSLSRLPKKEKAIVV